MTIAGRRRMRPGIWIVVALGTFLAACGNAGRQATTISVAHSAGGARLGIVKLSSPSFDLRYEGLTDLKVRIGISDGPEAEVFIRPYTMQDDMVLSDDCFVVRADGTFNTRKAKPETCGSDRTEKSWVRTNSLKPLLAWQQGDMLTFGGRRFAPRGTAYGTALSSGTGRYLASWSVTVRPYGSGIPAPGMGRGEIHSRYLEIFDVSTGQVLLSASSEELRSVSLGSWFGHSDEDDCISAHTTARRAARAIAGFRGYRGG